MLETQFKENWIEALGNRKEIGMPWKHDKSFQRENVKNKKNV